MCSVVVLKLDRRNCADIHVLAHLKLRYAQAHTASAFTALRKADRKSDTVEKILSGSLIGKSSPK